MSMAQYDRGEFRRLRVYVAAVLLLIAPAASAAPLKIVCSFTVLADFAKQVGGDDVDVRSLVGPNTDVHGFEPSPGDARLVATADLVIVNGLGLDIWLPKLARSAGFAGPVITATDGVTTIDAVPQAHGRGVIADPHAWQSIANARIYARNIADAIATKVPAHAEAIRQRAARYDASLAELDGEVRAQIEQLPPQRRILVTTHDAFGYFAHSYGLTLMAAQGISTENEPSAKSVANLIRQVKSSKAGAVFLENMSNPNLMERIAQETGAAIGGELYADALSKPDGPAPTYVEMVRHITRTLVAALKGQRA
jgi:zinc/manganese transport system substrate-binding protein